jgi:phage terminase Nu1 subunit (DNA packaging protein)
MAIRNNEFTVNALAELLPPSARTWKKHLEGVDPCRVTGSSKKQTTYYRLADAIKAVPPQLLGINTVADDGEVLDLQHESARLKKAQADKTELEVLVVRGELIPAEDVAGAWADMVSAMRAKLLAMPSAICAVLVGLGMRDIEREIKDYLYNSLEELSSGSKGKRASAGRSANKDVCDVGPTARPNG